MNRSLLLAIVNSKMKGKRKVMVVSGLRSGGWGRAAFIGRSILWIALGLVLVVCGRGQDACAHVVDVFKVCWMQRRGRDGIFFGRGVVRLGLGFICVYAVVIGSRVGANAMVLEVDGYGGLRNSGFGVY